MIGRSANIKYNFHVFTEQGIYMLMIVLKGEFAVKQSKLLICNLEQILRIKTFISWITASGSKLWHC